MCRPSPPKMSRGEGAIIFVREGREGLASKEEEEEYDVFMKQ